jgi:signal transduction histidine kinase
VITFSDRLPVKLIIWSIAAAMAAFVTDIGLNYLGWENTPGAEIEAVVTAGLMVYLFMLLRKLVLTPLREIEQVAERIKGGDLTARAHVTSSRELEVLADTMNSMVEKLATQYTQLEGYSQNLEKLVEERTRQLNAERELHISLLTHDLKSPITSIMGYSELMLDGGLAHLGTEEKEFIESIMANGKKLSDMVEQFLDLAKMDSGALSLSIEPFDLEALINKTVSDLSFQAREKHVSLGIGLTPGLPDIEGDIEKIGRVLTNLINNAIKYTPSGGKVTVSARSLDGIKDGFVEIQVVDNGYGIPENELGRVFDRYYRSSSSTGIKGTGLGLAVVKSFVEAHGGNVTVASRPGEGTSFTLNLPIRQDN